MGSILISCLLTNYCIIQTRTNQTDRCLTTLLVRLSLHISPSSVILTFFLWLVIVSQDLPQWKSLSLRVDNRAPICLQSVCAHSVGHTCICRMHTDTISGSKHSTVMLIHDHGMKLSGYHLHTQD